MEKITYDFVNNDIHGRRHFFFETKFDSREKCKKFQRKLNKVLKRNDGDFYDYHKAHHIRISGERFLCMWEVVKYTKANG